MTTADTRPEGTDAEHLPPAAGRPPRDSSSLALAAFVAVELAAFFLWVSLGSTEWFRGDDFDFFAARSAFDLHDLFADHGHHWKTLPMLVYRALWTVFGLRSYVPYLVLVVLAHLTVAALLRVVMRRAGVDAWIATSAATLFVLFGAGADNIVWSFQIGANTAIALGLVQLLLAGHDGPLTRRDAIGVAAGIGSIMCAGIGIALVATTTVATLLRRGWRPALLHGGIPAATWVTWWAVIGRDGTQDRSNIRVSEIAGFIRVGAVRTFGSLGQVPALGVVLVAVLVGGLALAWAGLDRASLRRRAAVPVALLTGAATYLLISAIGRVGANGPDRAALPHYQQVVAAFLISVLAIACDAIARRRRALTPLLCVMLLLGIPGNIDALVDRTDGLEATHRAHRQLILSIPRTDAAREAPRSATPAKFVTLGWLLDGVASGRIPSPPEITPDDERVAEFRLSFAQSDEAGSAAGPERCERLDGTSTRHFDAGDTLTIGKKVRLRPVDTRAPARAARTYRTRDGELLTAVRESFDAVVAPMPRGSVTMCFGPG
jgi:hypothetical protein